MAQQIRKKKSATPGKAAVGKRLTGIESSLSEMESQMYETKETMNKIEAMLAQLNQTPGIQPAQRTRTTKNRTRRQSTEPRPRRQISLLPFLGRKRQAEPRKLPSENGLVGMLKGVDPAALATMLQNPAVQSLITKGLNSGVASKPAAKTKKAGKPGAKATKNVVKKDGLGDMLGGMDFTQIAKLLQNPMVQSMLKNML